MYYVTTIIVINYLWYVCLCVLDFRTLNKTDVVSISITPLE